MTGYNYERGMSNNAVAAYENGRKPLSRIKVADLRAAGLTITRSFAVWLAENGHWTTGEYHHSGGTWYNEVDFYNPRDLAEQIDEGLIDIEALEIEYRAAQERKKEKKEREAEGVPVTGTYEVWAGSRRFRKRLDDQEFKGILIGNWIHLDRGGKVKADGKGVYWSKMPAEEAADFLAEKKREKERDDRQKKARQRAIERIPEIAELAKQIIKRPERGEPSRYRGGWNWSAEKGPPDTSKKTGKKLKTNFASYFKDPDLDKALGVAEGIDIEIVSYWIRSWRGQRWLIEEEFSAMLGGQTFSTEVEFDELVEAGIYNQNRNRIAEDADIPRILRTQFFDKLFDEERGG